METKNLLLLFEVIYGKGNIQKLNREGIDFAEIGNLLEFCAKNEYIENNKNKLIMTSKGLQMFKDLKTQFKRQNKKTWIEPEKESKILKIDKNEVFLPKQDELYFNT